MIPDLLRIPGSLEIPGEGHPDWRPVRKGLRMRMLFDGADGQRVALLHYRPGCNVPRAAWCWCIGRRPRRFRYTG